MRSNAPIYNIVLNNYQTTPPSPLSEIRYPPLHN